MSLQSKIANCSGFAPDFWENFARIIATLAAYNADMLRVDFDTFPLTSDAVNTRMERFACISNGAKLKWCFDGLKIRIVDLVEN